MQLAHRVSKGVDNFIKYPHSLDLSLVRKNKQAYSISSEWHDVIKAEVTGLCIFTPSGILHSISLMVNVTCPDFSAGIMNALFYWKGIGQILYRVYAE